MYHRPSVYPFFDKDYLGHTGSNTGYGTFMLFDPHTHTCIDVFLTFQW